MLALADSIAYETVVSGLPLEVEALDVGGGVVARGPEIFGKSEAGLPVAWRVKLWTHAYHDEGKPEPHIEVAVSGCTRLTRLRWTSTYQTPRGFGRYEAYRWKEPIGRRGWRPVAKLTLSLPALEAEQSQPLRASVLSPDPKCRAAVTIPYEHLRALLTWRERYLAEAKAFQGRPKQ